MWAVVCEHGASNPLRIHVDGVVFTASRTAHTATFRKMIRLTVLCITHAYTYLYMYMIVDKLWVSFITTSYIYIYIWSFGLTVRPTAHLVLEWPQNVLKHMPCFMSQLFRWLSAELQNTYTRTVEPLCLDTLGTAWSVLNCEVSWGTQTRCLGQPNMSCIDVHVHADAHR